jgi:hypothetical protein
MQSRKDQFIFFDIDKVTGFFTILVLSDNGEDGRSADNLHAAEQYIWNVS